RAQKAALLDQLTGVRQRLESTLEALENATTLLNAQDPHNSGIEHNLRYLRGVVSSMQTFCGTGALRLNLTLLSLEPNVRSAWDAWQRAANADSPRQESAASFEGRNERISQLKQRYEHLLLESL